MTTRTEYILADEMAELLSHFQHDPLFLRLLELANESAATFGTFINT